MQGTICDSNGASGGTAPADRQQLGHAQWIAHILSRLYLLDNGRRKRQMDGVVYAIQRTAVIDMMRRYDVMPISNS